MKKYIINSFIGLLSLVCVACFDDESTGVTTAVSDIEIEGIDTEKTYQHIGYVGETLSIPVTITSGYREDQLEYKWWLIDEKSGTEDEEGNTIPPVLIGSEKSLSFPVDIPTGKYRIRYQVTVKETGYTVYKQAKLMVTTEFSQGFYVLKETSDGHTEMDLITKDDEIGADLIQKKLGAALDGKPHSFWTNYNQWYIDEETDKMSTAHTIVVRTESGDIRVFRTTDLACILNRSNLLFETMDADEKPLAFFQTSQGTFYLSNKGIRSTPSGDSSYGAESSGKFAYPQGEPMGGKFVYHDVASMMGGYYFWDEIGNNLLSVNYSGQPAPLLTMLGEGAEETQNLAGFRCLACGVNKNPEPFETDSKGHFVLEASSGERYLYRTQTQMGMMQFYDGRSLVPANSKLAKATAFSTNGLQATYLYYLCENKLYGCDFTQTVIEDIEMPLTGIPGDETLTYVSNVFWNGYFGNANSNFDYLVIGTQKGNEYNLYMYQMVGGIPKGESVKTIKGGTGKLKGVRFLSQEFDSGDWDFNIPVYSIVD